MKRTDLKTGTEYKMIFRKSRYERGYARVTVLDTEATYHRYDRLSFTSHMVEEKGVRVRIEEMVLPKYETGFSYNRLGITHPDPDEARRLQQVGEEICVPARLIDQPWTEWREKRERFEKAAKERNDALEADRKEAQAILDRGKAVGLDGEVVRSNHVGSGRRYVVKFDLTDEQIVAAFEAAAVTA